MPAIYAQEAEKVRLAEQAKKARMAEESCAATEAETAGLAQEAGSIEVEGHMQVRWDTGHAASRESATGDDRLADLRAEGGQSLLTAAYTLLVVHIGTIASMLSDAGMHYTQCAMVLTAWP